jgi:cathepsin F
VHQCANKEYDLSKPNVELYDEYLSDFGVTFHTVAHHEENFKKFSDNVERIRTLNAKYPRTKFNLNKFALLTTEEFKIQYLSSFKPIRSPNDPVLPDLHASILKDIPDSFDWRDNKVPVVTPVKDQAQCGSCWAFSTIANIEGQWAMAGNKLTSLSEQNLVDCDHQCSTYDGEKSCDGGCDGGLPQNAYAYVMENGGIDTEDSYPYEGYDGKCRYKTNTIGAKISNWTFISKDESQVAARLVTQGPLSIAVAADEWQFYFGGVFYLPCGTGLDHAVTLVGYGNETNIFYQKMDYWTVKNSWGTGWGYSGYIYVERGVGECGINLYVSTAIVDK